MDMPEEREPLVFAPVLHSSYDGEKSVFGGPYGEEERPTRNIPGRYPHQFTGDAKEFNDQFTHSQIPEWKTKYMPFEHANDQIDDFKKHASKLLHRLQMHHEHARSPSELYSTTSVSPYATDCDDDFLIVDVPKDRDDTDDDDEFGTPRHGDGGAGLGSSREGVVLVDLGNTTTQHQEEDIQMEGAGAVPPRRPVEVQHTVLQKELHRLLTKMNLFLSKFSSDVDDSQEFALHKCTQYRERMDDIQQKARRRRRFKSKQRAGLGERGGGVSTMSVTMDSDDEEDDDVEDYASGAESSNVSLGASVDEKGDCKPVIPPKRLKKLYTDLYRALRMLDNFARTNNQACQRLLSSLFELSILVESLFAVMRSMAPAHVIPGTSGVNPTFDGDSDSSGVGGGGDGSDDARVGLLTDHRASKPKPKPRESFNFPLSQTTSSFLSNEGPVDAYTTLYEAFLSFSASLSNLDKNVNDPERTVEFASRIMEMLSQLEGFFARTFCGGDIEKARGEILARRHMHSDTQTFVFGLFCGISIPMFVWCILYLLEPGTISADAALRDFLPDMPVFRLGFLISLATWCWGINVFVWHKWRINYIFIFELEPSSALNHVKVFRLAAFLTCILSITFTFYFRSIMTREDVAFSIPPSTWPLVCTVFFFLIGFFPFRVFHRRTRWFLVKTLFQVVISPFGKIGFKEFYAGDVMTSMVKTLFDTEYAICFYVTGSFLTNNSDDCSAVNSWSLWILSALPYWWRLMQCLKRYYITRDVTHLFNSLKYMASLSVVLFSSLMGNLSAFNPQWDAYRVLWAISYVVATLYAYFWDLYMDWGLLRFVKCNILRPKKHTDPGTQRKEEEKRLWHELINTSGRWSAKLRSLKNTVLGTSASSSPTTDLRQERGFVAHALLRDTLVFDGSRWFYYWAMFSNLILRFFWALTITANPVNIGISPDMLTLIAATAEVLRRFQWSILRVENEHVNNCGKFREVLFIPLPFDVKKAKKMKEPKSL